MPWETLAQASIKHTPEDFVVQEVTGAKQADNLRSGTVVPVVKRHDFSFLTPNSQRRGYALLAMTKMGVPAPMVIDKVAKAAGIRSSEVRYSGQKDSQAVTAQLIDVPAHCLPQLTNSLATLGENIWLQFIGWSNRYMSFGAHDTNRFSINVYLVGEFNACKVGRRLEHIRRFGFYNFFGDQRFALPRALQAPAGKLMVLGQFSEAANYFCFAETNEAKDMAKKRQEANELASEGDYHGCLQLLEGDRRFNGEIAFLRERCRLGSWENALGSQDSRAWSRTSFFVRSWQSLLWNAALSKALQKGWKIPQRLAQPCPANKSAYAGLELDVPPADKIHPSIRGLFRCTVYRDTIVLPQHMRWEWQDERTLCVRFDLRSGAYATTLLEHAVDVR